jgi:hypothetical protein
MTAASHLKHFRTKQNTSMRDSSHNFRKIKRVLSARRHHTETISLKAKRSIQNDVNKPSALSEVS